MERCRLLAYRCVIGFGIVVAVLMGKSSISDGEMVVGIRANSRGSGEGEEEVITGVSKFDLLRDLDLGLKKGDTHALLSDVKLYLYTFGYLQQQEEEGCVFDERLEAGVRLYQSTFNLLLTGFLDRPTLDTLRLPRCGREDVRDGLPLMPRNSSEQEHWMAGQWNLITGQRKWQSTRNLTYAFSSTIALAQSPILSQDDVRSAIASAFKTWSAVIPLDFSETGNFEEAQIKIEFAGGEHGDGWAFDGVLGVVSHAFAPEDGRFHLDTAETWTVSMRLTAASSALDLQTVALHEIGHLIGLDHSNLPHSVMFPTLQTRFTRRQLTHDDIMGATALYATPNIASISNSHSCPRSQFCALVLPLLILLYCYSIQDWT